VKDMLPWISVTLYYEAQGKVDQEVHRQVAT